MSTPKEDILSRSKRNIPIPLLNKGVRRAPVPPPKEVKQEEEKTETKVITQDKPRVPSLDRFNIRKYSEEGKPIVSLLSYRQYQEADDYAEEKLDELQRLLHDYDDTVNFVENKMDSLPSIRNRLKQISIDNSKLSSVAKYYYKLYNNIWNKTSGYATNTWKTSRASQLTRNFLLRFRKAGLGRRYPEDQKLIDYMTLKTNEFDIPLQASAIKREYGEYYGNKDALKSAVSAYKDYVSDINKLLKSAEIRETAQDLRVFGTAKERKQNREETKIAKNKIRSLKSKLYGSGVKKDRASLLRYQREIENISNLSLNDRTSNDLRKLANRVGQLIEGHNLRIESDKDIEDPEVKPSKGLTIVRGGEFSDPSKGKTPKKETPISPAQAMRKLQETTRPLPITPESLAVPQVPGLVVSPGTGEPMLDRPSFSKQTEKYISDLSTGTDIMARGLKMERDIALAEATKIREINRQTEALNKRGEDLIENVNTAIDRYNKGKGSIEDINISKRELDDFTRSYALVSESLRNKYSESKTRLDSINKNIRADSEKIKVNMRSIQPFLKEDKEPAPDFVEKGLSKLERNISSAKKKASPEDAKEITKIATGVEGIKKFYRTQRKIAKKLTEDRGEILSEGFVEAGIGAGIGAGVGALGGGAGAVPGAVLGGVTGFGSGVLAGATTRAIRVGVREYLPQGESERILTPGTYFMSPQEAKKYSFIEPKYIKYTREYLPIVAGTLVGIASFTGLETAGTKSLRSLSKSVNLSKTTNKLIEQGFTKAQAEREARKILDKAIVTPTKSNIEGKLVDGKFKGNIIQKGLVESPYIDELGDIRYTSSSYNLKAPIELKQIDILKRLRPDIVKKNGTLIIDVTDAKFAEDLVKLAEKSKGTKVPIKSSKYYIAEDGRIIAEDIIPGTIKKDILDYPVFEIKGKANFKITRENLFYKPEIVGRGGDSPGQVRLTKKPISKVLSKGLTDDQISSLGAGPSTDRRLFDISSLGAPVESIQEVSKGSLRKVSGQTGVTKARATELVSTPEGILLKKGKPIDESLETFSSFRELVINRPKTSRLSQLSVGRGFGDTNIKTFATKGRIDITKKPVAKAFVREGEIAIDIVPENTFRFTKGKLKPVKKSVELSELVKTHELIIDKYGRRIYLIKGKPIDVLDIIKPPKVSKDTTLFQPTEVIAREGDTLGTRFVFKEPNLSKQLSSYAKSIEKKGANKLAQSEKAFRKKYKSVFNEFSDLTPKQLKSLSKGKIKPLEALKDVPSSFAELAGKVAKTKPRGGTVETLTKSGLVQVTRTKQLTIPKIKVSTKQSPTFKTSLSQFSESLQKQKTLSQTKSKVKQKQVTRQISKTLTVPKIRLKTMTETKPALISKTKQITSPAQARTQETSTKQISRRVGSTKLQIPQVNIPAIPSIPKTGLNVPDGNQIDVDKLSKKTGGWDVYVREKGTPIKVSKKPMNYISAFNMGLEVVDETEAGSFNLKKVKRKGTHKEKKNNLGRVYKFRPPKSKEKNVFVEKETYRIDSRGEVRGVSAKGWGTPRKDNRGRPKKQSFLPDKKISL